MNDKAYQYLTNEKSEPYVGRNHPLNTVVRSRIDSGPGHSLECIDVRTACGISAQILPDRGMGIGEFSYRGIPLAWISPAGIWYPAHDSGNPRSLERTFYGGLLTTCGLTQAGAGCHEGEEYLPLHGRVSYLPAERTAIIDEEDDFLTVTGRVRESTMYEENLVLRRKLKFGIDQAEVVIEDTVTNEGCRTSPFMLLYHLNFGYPLIAPGLEIKSSLQTVEGLNDFAKSNALYSFHSVIITTASAPSAVLYGSSK